MQLKNLKTFVVNTKIIKYDSSHLMAYNLCVDCKSALYNGIHGIFNWFDKKVFQKCV